MRTVFIIDSNYPKDHYLDRADCAIAQQVLKTLGIKADLRVALDREYFEKATRRALTQGRDVLHISCHGDDNGIGLCSDDPDSELPMGLSWDELTALFQDHRQPPTALVMSACCGAASGLGQSFARVPIRPEIIIGSTDKRYPADYVAAWTLLYRRFKRSGINRDSAQRVLRDICAVVHKNFRYLRWDDDQDGYRHFPATGRQYEVSEI
jgi:hypothetical protein